MSNSKVLKTKRPGLFKSKMRTPSGMTNPELARSDGLPHSPRTFINTNLTSTSSFRYGDKEGLISTQQLPVDYSSFENHTFFHSAVAKVNESFDKIINFYPFDQNNKKVEEYEDHMTGFEKYILDTFPKNIGYLIFSGTQVDEPGSNGNYISVVDKAGSELSSIASNKTGASLLDPQKSPFHFEFFLNIPKIANDSQIIVQRTSGSSAPLISAHNMTIALSQSSDVSKCNLIFGVTSGSNFIFASSSIDKGRFVHVSAGYDKDRSSKLHLRIDVLNEVTSSRSVTFSDGLTYPRGNLNIGSGSTVRLDDKIFTPKQTFSGSIDEFRYFTSFRSREESDHYRYRSLAFNNDNKLVDSLWSDKKRAYTRQTPNLKVYFKFNEPEGSYSGNNIVLDSSGNSFSTKVFNFTVKNRQTGSDVPMSGEILDRHPVIFPDYAATKTRYTDLITSASLYDDFNPNLITKLVPHHYFDEGNDSEGFNDIMGTFENSSLRGGSGPKSKQLRSSQRLTIFLLIWAKFFDELKMFTDAFSNLKNLSYDDYETIPGALLRKSGELQGVKLPALFRSSHIKQLFEGVDLEKNPAASQLPLLKIQNIIWRRILSSLPHLRATRGTLNSVRSVFKSSGIDPDNLLLIREFGGNYERSIDAVKENKKDIIKLLSFSGSFSTNTQTLDYQGRPNLKPTLKSGFLSGARIEPGVPAIRGTFVNKDSYPPHGISDNQSDGLWTSSSFTFEGQYRFHHRDSHFATQSLARLHVTGSSHASSYESVVANLLYNSGTNELTLFLVDSPSQDDGMTTPYSHAEVKLKDVNMNDSDLWNVSFGVDSSKEAGYASTGSIFLRAGKSSNGRIDKYHATSSLYHRTLSSSLPTLEHGKSATSMLSNITSSLNTSGAFICIGSQSLGGGSTGMFINDNSLDKFYRSTEFSGEVGEIRFWSKSITEDEWKSHVRNPLSYGTNDPLVSYLYETGRSGSFEKLRLKTFSKQSTTSSNASGEFTYFDFTKNNKHMTGSGFEPNKLLVRPEYLMFNTISPNFDLSIADKKVRVRSLSDLSRQAEHPFATTGPVYEAPPNERTIDDPRFAIEMSVMKGLNDDIVRLFSDYDFLETALGKTNLLFGDRYPDLIQLRKLYFNNILETIRLGKYRSLFKFIDNAFTELVGEMLPHTTKFMGINFVYENHMLERNSFEYLYDEIYLKSKPMTSDRSLLLSQFVIILSRI